jgi:DNA-binding NarL/FixJ family response regulator
VRRAEILLWHGVWQEAVDEALRACEQLSKPSVQPAVGAAFYLLGELYRLRGEFPRAEEAYRHASDAGRTPQPGLALLRLAQNRIDAAKAAICVVTDANRDRRRQSAVLAACVEIQLASHDIPAAKQAADGLRTLEAATDTPFLRALAAQADGAIMLAEGDARGALAALDRARTLWRELEARYEAARAGTLMGLAYRELGDTDTGAMELDAARKTFRDLGAGPDLNRLEGLCKSAEVQGKSGLTARELEVLRLVASGKSNRAIADKLQISEKTVARHVSNIFNKLDLSSRAAATAYAFQHDMI